MKQSVYVKERGFSLIAVIISLVLLAVLGLIGWRLTQNHSSPKPEPPRQTEQTQSMPSETTVKIEEWKVQFTPKTGLNEASFYHPNDLGDNYLTFTTKELTEASSNCSFSSGKIALGLLSRHKQEYKFGTLLAEINGYRYYFQGPQATCTDKGDLEATTLPLLVDSLKTLEASAPTQN